MNFEFTNEQNILRESVRRVMDKVATAEYIRLHDRAQTYPHEVYQAWVDLGLLAMPFSEDVGGLGGGPVDMMIIAEEISRKSYDFYAAYSAGVFTAHTLCKKGSKEQIDYWMPKFFDGSVKMSTSISEPSAGSDVGAIRTTARRDGAHWIINGQKLWATGAGASGNLINVYARTDTAASHREALSLFLVRNDTPGVECRKLDMLGRYCVGTYEIFFTDVRIPADSLIGEVNKGWECMLGGLQYERLTTAAGYYGSSQEVVDMASAYAKERMQFSKPIGSNQVIAHMLADMQTEVDAARLLTWRAAWLMEQGRDALKEIAMAKLMGSETFVKVAAAGMQIMGGYGYNLEYDMQRYFRDSRSVTIGAGTSQIQRNLIANMMGLKVR
jgi:alkylation response protein AidB-like acyl-CoA dehydrogenase